MPIDWCVPLAEWFMHKNIMMAHQCINDRIMEPFPSPYWHELGPGLKMIEDAHNSYGNSLKRVDEAFSQGTR